MAKEIRIHLTRVQKARLDPARENVPSETPDSNRKEPGPEDSSGGPGPNPTGPRKFRPTVFSRIP
jgi:hypothetical protein